MYFILEQINDFVWIRKTIPIKIYSFIQSVVLSFVFLRSSCYYDPSSFIFEFTRINCSRDLKEKEKKIQYVAQKDRQEEKDNKG